MKKIAGIITFGLLNLNVVSHSMAGNAWLKRNLLARRTLAAGIPLSAGILTHKIVTAERRFNHEREQNALFRRYKESANKNEALFNLVCFSPRHDVDQKWQNHIDKMCSKQGEKSIRFKAMVNPHNADPLNSNPFYILPRDLNDIIDSTHFRAEQRRRWALLSKALGLRTYPCKTEGINNYVAEDTALSTRVRESQSRLDWNNTQLNFSLSRIKKDPWYGIGGFF